MLCAECEFEKGEATRCPECNRSYCRERYQAKKAEYKERAARWAAENHERRREIARAYGRRNPERVQRNSQRWRAENPERARAQSAEWREANRDRHNRMVAAWKRKNRDRQVVAQGARRARKARCFVEHVEPLVLLELDDGACGICGEDVDPFDFTIDHVIPLDPGDHSYGNTQVAHRGCNTRKGRRLMEEVV
jgi:5-methylcytosine-specific restriction endonuclease McrA